MEQGTAMQLCRALNEKKVQYPHEGRSLKERATIS